MRNFKLQTSNSREAMATKKHKETQKAEVRGLKNFKSQHSTSTEVPISKALKDRLRSSAGARTALSADHSLRSSVLRGQGCPRSYGRTIESMFRTSLALVCCVVLNVCSAENLLLSNAVVHTITGETIIG